jgi:hypothetical protein
MDKPGEITSLTNRIESELSSFNTGYLEELAGLVAEFMYKYDPEGDSEEDLMDAAATVGGALEDLAACFEDTVDAVKYLRSLLEK